MKSSASKTYTADALAQSANEAGELERSLGGAIEVEKGFHPATWWAEVWDKKATATRLKIREYCESGRMEMKIFPVPDIAGRQSPIPHYKAVK